MFVKISSVANAREPLARCPERGFYQFKKGCFRTLVKTTILMKSVVVNPRQMLSSVIIIIHHITIRPHRSTLPTKKQHPWGSCVPSALFLFLGVLASPPLFWLFFGFLGCPVPVLLLTIYNYIHLFTTTTYKPTTTLPMGETKWWDEGETKVKRRWNRGETKT